MRDAVGLVLAGGRGERLALGTPKARVLLEGRTLLERAVERLAAVCREVRVVAPPELDLGEVAAPRVADVPGVAGPLAGLVAGLEAADGRGALVLGVDFPGVETVLLERLLERLEDGSAGPLDAVVPRPGGTAQPLVAAYAPSAAPLARAALERGGRSLRGAIGTLRVHWLDDAELARLPGGLESLLNVNTPDDLERARRLVSGARRC